MSQQKKIVSIAAAGLVLLFAVILLIGSCGDGDKPAPPSAQKPATTKEPVEQPEPPAEPLVVPSAPGETPIKVGPKPKDPKIAEIDPQDWDPEEARKIQREIDAHKFIQELPYEDSEVSLDFGPGGKEGGKVELLVVSYESSREQARAYINDLLQSYGDKPEAYRVVFTD